jgi:glutathione S-transferase
VPALRHGDLLVHDSLAICEYLAELFPHAHLWPADRATRARARAVTAEMHSSFVAIRSSMPMDILATKPGVGHTPAALADVARIHEIWHECLARSGGRFLFGAFSIADAFFAPVTVRFTGYGVPLDATCQAYVEAVQSLPEFLAWRDDATREPELPNHQ